MNPSTHKPQKTDIFGGSKEWLSKSWTSSDDRVRGGSSTSFLTPLPSSPSPSHPNTALFHGTLDTQTLGGAGFASQRTTTDEIFDFSSFEGGLEIEILKEGSRLDGKRYNLVLKDDVVEDRGDGREGSTVSWECEFRISSHESNGEEGDSGKETVRIWCPWSEWKATYRGRAVEGKTLNKKSIRRVGIMMRSYFAKQEGEFGIVIVAIRGVGGDKRDEEEGMDMDVESVAGDEKAVQEDVRDKKGWFSRMWRGARLC